MNLTFEQFWTMMDRAERQMWDRFAEGAQWLWGPLPTAKDQPDSPRNLSGGLVGTSGPLESQ